MLKIHILLVPLIITALIWFTAWMSNNFKSLYNNEVDQTTYVYMILGVIAGFISALIYMSLGLIWIYNHVEIVF